MVSAGHEETSQTLSQSITFQVSFLQTHLAGCFYIWQLWTMIENHTTQIGARINWWAHPVAWQSMFPIDLFLPCFPERQFPVSLPPQCPKHICSPVSLQIALLKGNSQSFLLTTTDLPTSTPDLALLSATTSSSSPFSSSSSHSYYVSPAVFFSDASHLLCLLFSCIFTSFSITSLCLSLCGSIPPKNNKLKYPVLSAIVSFSPNLSISSPLSSQENFV